MPGEGPSKEELAADCPYINEYCRDRHRGVVRCAWLKEKGRILLACRSFCQGEVIFREPPLHIVAEQPQNEAFERLKKLCDQGARSQLSDGKVFEYEPLWYWTALCSLKPGQLGPAETRLKPITEDQQRKLLLLYHKEVSQASEAAETLVRELGLRHVTAIELEALLQVWILNCFEHSDDPLGYSAYFMSSFMSHSCIPNAVWHYQGDDFVLRARRDIEDGDEICVSYLSEDSLLESIDARRKHLEASKYFTCTCDRCNAPTDTSRGFKCPRCPGIIFHTSRRDGKDFAAAAWTPCNQGGHALAAEEADRLLAEERWLQGWCRRCESESRPRARSFLQQLEESASRAERSFAQHYLLDSIWQFLSSGCSSVGRLQDAELVMRKRIEFQEAAYPGLSGTRAWTLEAYGDMVLRHNSVKLQPHPKVPDHRAAQAIAAAAVPQVYKDSLAILRLMFGEEHEYFVSVEHKARALEEELQRLLDEGSSGAPAREAVPA